MCVLGEGECGRRSKVFSSSIPFLFTGKKFLRSAHFSSKFPLCARLLPSHNDFPQLFLFQALITLRGSYASPCRLCPQNELMRKHRGLVFWLLGGGGRYGANMRFFFFQTAGKGDCSFIFCSFFVRSTPLHQTCTVYVRTSSGRGRDVQYRMYHRSSDNGGKHA